VTRRARRIFLKNPTNILYCRAGVAFAPFFFSNVPAAPDSRVFLYIPARRSLNALPTTDTELKLIAAAAMTGLSRMPENG
jgi:hypothetical protein